MKRKGILLALFAIFLQHISLAQNPIMENIGMSDPHVRVFNDSIFLYCGHDSSVHDRTWIMKDWHVLSSTDLVNWSLRDTISPDDNYMQPGTQDCWAGDAASRNGKYYFYFSDRKRGIGVMEASSPTGPFKDALGKPLVAPMHDPTILIDDDSNKTPYIVYGDKEGGGFHVAKLNDDMISLAESPKLLKIMGEAWQNAPKWMDKNYIFKHDGTYYLSWGQDYAMAKNIYGPYESVGAVGNGQHLSEYAHGSFFTWKGQFYHIWCYYIRAGYKYRESIITYCHFDDEGHIVTDTDFLDKHFSNGVGQYRASWERIEAEWFYDISGNIQKKGSRKDGFTLTQIKSGDWIKFANLTFDKDYVQLIAHASWKGAGVLEIRTDSVEGKLLGKVALPESASSTFLQEVSCSLEGIASPHTTGRKDVFLIFKGQETSELQLDWFRFEGKKR